MSPCWRYSLCWPVCTCPLLALFSTLTSLYTSPCWRYSLHWPVCTRPLAGVILYADQSVHVPCWRYSLRWPVCTCPLLALFSMLTSLYTSLADCIVYTSPCWLYSLRWPVCTRPLAGVILYADQSVHVPCWLYSVHVPLLALFSTLTSLYVCVPGEDQGGTQGEGSQGEERGEGGGEGWSEDGGEGWSDNRSGGGCGWVRDRLSQRLSCCRSQETSQWVQLAIRQTKQ